MRTKPVVAIVGRPNVGKSTLFNRIVGQMRAVVDSEPGVTRDRHYGDAEWGGRRFILIDTGGYLPDASEGIEAEVKAQADVAVQEAHLLVFVVDVETGVTDIDMELARLLLRQGRDPILVVNKVESEHRLPDVHEFMKLGLGEPLEISAFHGQGVGELLDGIVERIPEVDEARATQGIAISFVGRPNVGKSSLVNKVVGQDKMIVHEKPGTTRDAIDTIVETEGQTFTLIDTAGLRRKSKIERGVELYSTMRTIKGIERCDVGVVVVDAADGVYQQDMRIASMVFEAGAAVLVVFNKWDLVDRDRFDFKVFESFKEDRFHFLKHAEVLRVSALTGSGTSNILPSAAELAGKLNQRIPTSALNRVLQDAVRNHAPPSFHGKEVKIYYATQLDRKWPTFVMFANRPSRVAETYKRYLTNRLREAFQFNGIKLTLVFKKK